MQPYALQNVESVAQLLKQAFTDLEIVGAEFQRVKPAFGVAHAEVEYVGQVEVAHAHGKGFTAQSRSAAVRTGRLAAVAGLQHAVLNLVRTLFDHLKKGVDSGKVGTALPQHRVVLWAELLYGAVNGEPSALGSAQQLLLPFAKLFAAPRRYGILKHTQSGVRNHQFRVNSQHGTKSLARGAGALWRVERKQSRSGFFKAHTLGLKPVRELVHLLFNANAAGSLTFVQRRLNGICGAGIPVLIAGSGRDAVHHQFYALWARIFVQAHNTLRGGPHPGVALAAQKFPKCRRLSIFHVERSRHERVRPLGLRFQKLEDVRDAVALDFGAAGCIGASDAGKK